MSAPVAGSGREEILDMESRLSSENMEDLTYVEIARIVEVPVA